MDVWKRFGEKEVSHSMVHYLQAVAAIKTEKGYARVSDVALRLGVSRSGVTSMMQTLHARGLVNHERYGCVELTATGGRLAKRTESSRHVLTVFLTEMLGVPEAVAQEDACMIEHLVSPEVMIELVCLTAFMRSEHPAALQFREAYSAHPRGCTEEAPGECDLCGGACLHDSLTRELKCETEAK
ncbi:MAG: metal-dependent transcriptional regulator [Candidatus Eisenbacteria bacterium]|nr:metal-dependent transcriptional regulator [Candidatus Eisenbacteria bacterium]